MRANNRASENPSSTSFGDQFDEAVGLPHHEGFAMVIEWIGGCHHFVSCLPSLLLAHATGSHLRLGKAGEELQAVVERHRFSTPQERRRILTGSLSLRDGNVDDLVGSTAIPGGKEMPSRGALLEVGTDGMSLKGDTGFFQSKASQSRATPQGIHHDGGLHRELPVPMLEADCYPVTVTLDRVNARAAEHLDAASTKSLRHRLGDIAVATGEELRIPLKDRDLGS